MAITLLYYGGILLVFFFFVQAMITQPNGGSVLYFNTSGPLDCDPSQTTPGFITSIFLANRPFAFGCLCYHETINPTYFLSVAISIANFPNVPIWVANRYRPVKDNATVSVDSRGSIVLTDVDGSVIWDSNTSNVAGMRLAPDGNLIMFDNLGSIVWQSFDEPIDLLVPNQSLKTNQTLVSGFSSSLISPTGNFTAQMNPGGLILYELSSSRPLPYYAIQYPFFPSTVNDILTSPCNHTQLHLNYNNLTLVQVPPSSSCKPPLVNNNAVRFDSQVAFVRLDPDGNIRGYHPDYEPSFDLFKASTRGLCGIPNVCGPYGVCNASNTPPCQCPGGNQSLAIFSQQGGVQQYMLSSTTCTPKVPMDDCKQAQQDGKNESFLDLEKVDYFANDYIAPTMLSESFELCKAACATNCSCRAAFYRAHSHQCFLQDDVLSMIQVSTSDYQASIKYESLDKTRRKSEMKLIIGISIASLVSITFLLMWHCHSTAGPHTILLKDEDELLASLPGQPKRFKFKDLRAATSEFSHKLGVGGFGSVYKGAFPDGSSVAVKQLENATKTTQGLKEFRNEVIALSNINHQNLVHLRGFCADGPHRLLVYEFMPNGSLDTWLFRKGSSDSPGQRPLDWKTRLSIAVHTARGLFFLHEQCRNRIVHLDIKPQNILLDEKFVAKISDFGLSRLINEDETCAVTRMRGTPGYMAPECLILTDATEKSDVYSFGMVLLEVVSGRKNVDVSRLVLYGDGEGWYFPAMAAKKLQEGHMEEILDKTLLGLLGHDGMAQATRVVQTAFWCIQDEPSLRPTMANVLLMLQGYAPVSPPPLSFHFGMLFHRTNTTQCGSSITPSSLSIQSDNAPPTKLTELLPESNLEQHHQQGQGQGQEQQDQQQQQQQQQQQADWTNPPSSNHISSLHIASVHTHMHDK